jgi:hypothetical protein
MSIQFDERSGDPEPGRLIESTVWVNTAHPAYRRAVASRSEGYHVAVSAALALARVAVEPADEHGFLGAFLARWGEVLTTAVPDAGRGRRPTRDTSRVGIGRESGRSVARAICMPRPAKLARQTRYARAGRSALLAARPLT